MRSLVVFAALLAAVALAAESEITIKFEDKNLTDAEASFSYRFQHSQFISIPTIVTQFISLPQKVYIWSSASVDANAATSRAKAKANGLLALAVPPANNIFPFAIVGYAQGKATIDLKLDQLLKNIFVDGSFSGTFQGGMLAMAALTLEELNPNGESVNNKIYLVSPSSKICSPEEVKEKDGVHGMTCTQKYDGDTKVIFTYLTSKNAGILEYGETPVSPRSIEMIIDVQNFPLKDTKNHVRLNIGFVSASGDGTVDGTGAMKYIKNDGEQVYVAASKYAVVNGERREIDVSVKSDKLMDNDKYLATFDAALRATVGKKYDAHVAHVDFPAGVKSFVYDPAAGCGSNVYQAGASTVALSLFAVIACVLLYLF